jgi:hypothetical protein
VENFTDYDLERQIINAAAKLGIPVNNRKIEDIYSNVEERCPAVTETILDKTVGKNKLKDYLNKYPSRVVKNDAGMIIIGSDPYLNTYVNNDVKLYQGILDAIEKCNKG